MENGDTEYIARSPWKERENLPKPSVLLTIIAMATTVLCSAFYASAQTEFISLCLATASFAFLLVMDRRWYVLSAIPLSYLLALLLFTGGDGVRALFSLAFVPLSFLLALALFRGMKCSVTVGLLTLLTLLVTAGVMASSLSLRYGSVAGGFQTILSQIAAEESQTIEMMKSELSTMPESLATIYQGYIEDLESSFNTLIYAVPGMWICLSALSMWAAAKLVRRGIMRCGAHDIFFYKNWNIMVPAGWVFAFIAVTVAALVIAFLPESENKLRYSAILFNFSSVIELPLLGIGFRRARITLRKLKTLGFPFPIWVIVLLFVLVTICQPSLSLVALTCIGAWYILKRYLDKKKKSPPEDPSDGPSDDRTES